MTGERKGMEFELIFAKKKEESARLILHFH
jgi:hypothetical protein